MFTCTFLKYDRGAAVLQCVETRAVLRCTAEYAFDGLSTGARVVVRPERWNRSANALECTVGQEGPPVKRSRVHPL